jgi:hypothetical protein
VVKKQLEELGFYHEIHETHERKQEKIGAALFHFFLYFVVAKDGLSGVGPDCRLMVCDL